MITKPNRLGGLLPFFQCAKNTVRYLNLFVASGVAKAKLEKIAGMALPMIGLMVIVLLICTYIPEVPLCLVGAK